MNAEYSMEEVRAIARRLHDDITVADGDALMASDMLTAYADSIERAQAEVTDEVVERAFAAMDAAFRREYSVQLDETEKSLALEGVRAALLAVWPSVPAQPTDSGRAATALRGLLEIGKRDLTNPKYDGLWNEARAALAAQGQSPASPAGVPDGLVQVFAIPGRYDWADESDHGRFSDAQKFLAGFGLVIADPSAPKGEPHE